MKCYCDHKYDGYMKLSYLHPKYISKRNDKTEKIFLIRISALQAYHDTGRIGLNENIFDKIIEILELKGKVYISSEGTISKRFKKFKNSFHIFLINVYNEIATIITGALTSFNDLIKSDTA